MVKIVESINGFFRSTVQRTARRGPFLTVARARERIAMYINDDSNITHRAQKERQGRPEQTPRVSKKILLRSKPVKCIIGLLKTYGILFCLKSIRL